MCLTPSLALSLSSSLSTPNHTVLQIPFLTLHPSLSLFTRTTSLFPFSALSFPVSVFHPTPDHMVQQNPCLNPHLSLPSSLFPSPLMLPMRSLPPSLPLSHHLLTLCLIFFYPSISPSLLCNGEGGIQNPAITSSAALPALSACLGILILLTVTDMEARAAAEGSVVHSVVMCE